MPKPNPKPRSLRAQAFEESNYPDDVTGTRCVEIRIPDADEFMAQLAGMVALATKRFNYQNKDIERAKAVAQAWVDAYLITDWAGCMNCEELTQCLSPFFTEILEKLDALQITQDETKELVEQSNAAQKVQQPTPITVTGCDDGNIMSGAKSVLERLNTEVVQVFERTEAEAPDKAQEVVSIISGLFTGLFKAQMEGVPLAEAMAMGNWYFENQVATYQTDYSPEFVQDAACSLYCAVVTNDCEITTDVISAWLVSLRDDFPGNNAADIFARFGDAATPTLINQIGMFLNSLRGDTRSITDFYNELIFEFGLGSQDTDASWMDCDCPLPFAPIFGLGVEACYTGAVSGDNLIYNSGSGIWEADGTLDAFTNNVRITLKEADGRAFQFNTFTSSVAVGGAVWTLASDGICYGGAGQFPPDDTPLLALIWAIQNTGTPLHVGFNFFE